MSNVIVGQKVVAPSTDADGEVSFVIGLLTAINSRMATVELSDGTILKVGKTKVEPFIEEKRTKPRRASDAAAIDSGKYNYCRVKAASGRSSLDNGDKIATLLREKSLEEVYNITSIEIAIPVDTLKAAYKHLNAGQQRMCLGNRIRGKYKKLGQKK